MGPDLLASSRETLVPFPVIDEDFEKLLTETLRRQVLDALVKARRLSEDFREEIGLEGYATKRGEKIGSVARVLGPAARGAMKVFLRVAGNRSRKKSQRSQGV